MLGITIVTPSLNQATYLEQCIDSILSQNYPNLEYIIMDGGSTDGSVEIIKKYQKHLSYWQSKPDGGHYQALNAGFARSHSPVMGWLNADDMLHHGGLAKLDEVFSRLPEVEFLTAKRVGFDANGDMVSYGYKDQTWFYDLLLCKELVCDYSLFVMQEATYWRRSLWERAGACLDTNYSLAADFELWLRMSRYAPLHTVNTATGGFRLHSSEQRCNRERDKYVTECCQAIDRERELSPPPAPHHKAPPQLILYPLTEPSPAPPGAPEVLVKSLPPRISLVTPSYNQGEYLEECIDSILSQNYPNLEYIVIDGGSTDNSVEIIKKHARHLNYWQSRRDEGQYSAINQGFMMATGEIMAWLNSDDKYHPGALWLVSDAFRAHPEIEWLTGSPTIWDRDGRAAGFSLEPPRWSRDKYLRGEIKAPYIQQESTFWRQSLWDKIGLLIDTNFQAAADLELWARFFRHAQLHTLHAPLGGFRSHPGEGQRSEVLQDLYQKETESIVARERSFFSNSGSPQLQPAPQPLLMGELVERAQSRITPENFGFFSYSRSIHFPYFAGMDLELYSQAVTPGSCGVRTYQELLAYTFIRHNLPKGARILATARAHSRLAAAAGTDYEFWALSEDGSQDAALPEGNFDLVLDILPVGQDPTAQDRCHDICHQLARVLKPGGRALHCFDLRAGATCFASHPLLPYLLQATGGRGVMPFEQAPLDPFVFFSSEAPLQPGRGEAPAQAGGEAARWLSYNVLWSPEQMAQAARPAATLRTPPAPAPEAHPAPRRLHIGGEERSEGWEILNILPGPHVDHLGNANDLSRFSDGSFQEIYASHTVEHFDYQNELLATLKEWHRVLRPFGTLYLSVPDLDVMARLLLDKERLNVDDRFAVMRMMFGGHMDPHDFHGVGLNEDFLTYFLHQAGFGMMQKVDKFGLFQDTSYMVFKGELISLNMVARKLPNR